ncbi:MAG TPA: aquaporin [Candidatus Limnocylindrales bacterium]|nr:aquaporin [Candidatus Limnocylindrales bacterium]
MMNLRVVAAELIGTFILVGFGCLSAIAAGASGVPTSLMVPFGFGLSLLAGIAIFGHVSGAHFNPAVTLAALFDGRISLVGAIAYGIAQVIGAVLGALAILALFNKDAVDAVRNTPASVISDAQAFGIEAVLTAVFVAVILTVTARASSQAIFVIPLTLMMIHFVAVPISGASVNPARSLGPAIVAGDYAHLWVYLSAPFLGSLIGWGVYRLMGIFDEGAGAESQGERGYEEALLDD